MYIYKIQHLDNSDIFPTSYERLYVSIHKAKEKLQELIAEYTLTNTDQDPDYYTNTEEGITVILSRVQVIE